MSEEIIEEFVPSTDPVLEPVVEVLELEYRYQPKDESGRSLGAPQVIKYKTQDELADKLAEQNTLLIRKLREQTRKNRLGEGFVDTLPEDTQRFGKTVELKTRQLTAEERAQISRDLLDPEKCEEAQSTMFEATVGMKPSDLGTTLRELQTTNTRILAKTESDAFMASNPPNKIGGYLPCLENYEAIAGWMSKNDLAPLRQNFQLAFDTLRADGVMLMPDISEARPQPEPVVEPVVPVVSVETVVEEIPVTPTPKRVPTGFTRDNASDGAPVAKKEAYTLAEIERMSSEEYKRLLHKPGFAELVNKLEAEAAAKRGQKRRS